MASELLEIGGKRYRRVPSLWDCTGCAFDGKEDCLTMGHDRSCIDYDDLGCPDRQYIFVEADDLRTDAEIQRHNAVHNERIRLRIITDELLKVTQRSTLRRIAEKLLMRLSEVPDGEDDPWITEQLKGYR